MAQLLIKGVDAYNANPEKDRGCYKRGDPVEVEEDRHIWGNGNQPPAFVVISVPLIPKAKLQKYLAIWFDPDWIPAVSIQSVMVDGVKTEIEIVDAPAIIRRRMWRLCWEDLPLSARNKLRDKGTLVIKATDAYTGLYDFTWAQVRMYIRNLMLDIDETENL